jgi:hypothetical protein
MIEEYQIRVLPQVAYSEANIAQYLIEEKGLDAQSLTHVRVLRHSIDARQRTIYVNLKVRAYINEMPQEDEFTHTDYPDVSEKTSGYRCRRRSWRTVCGLEANRVGLSSL